MNAATYAVVRELLSETLSVDVDEITPKSNFFHDLGGESIDVLDLSFRCEKNYQVPMRFQELTESAADGTLSPAAQRLRESFPTEDGTDPKLLFTVEVIVAYVEDALARHRAAA